MSETYLSIEKQVSLHIELLPFEESYDEKQVLSYGSELFVNGIKAYDIEYTKESFTLTPVIETGWIETDMVNQLFVYAFSKALESDLAF